ncbi:hypothetical protein ACMFMG_007132, partial [Clarireedia jacksonii]
MAVGDRKEKESAKVVREKEKEAKEFKNKISELEEEMERVSNNDLKMRILNRLKRQLEKSDGIGIQGDEESSFEEQGVEAELDGNGQTKAD